jgi:hypothetical protein
MGTLGYIIVVVVCVIIVAAIIALMMRRMPGGGRIKDLEAPERERETKPRTPFLQRIKSKFMQEPDEESVIPAPPLEPEVQEIPDLAAGPVVNPIAAAAPVSDNEFSLQTEIPVPPAEEEEETEALDVGTLQPDDELNTFRIEIAEDDGLSRIAESLEEIDLDKLSEIARDISSKGREKSGR